ncbi:VOC family protein [Paraburkholderia sediminicola]|uniref:VOC family protein n=1 Tax=Paraburkholderia sediminicola TaxID=458836 RepID=UPI0038B7FD2D
MSIKDMLFSSVATRLPTRDLSRARRWYAEKLGLEPIEERHGGLRYRIGDGEFSLFHSSGTSPGTFTQLAITVADIHKTATLLRDRGVQLLDYDGPSLRTVDGIARVEGNYPSKGSAELGCWFFDSEGNMIAIGQSLP